MLNIKLRNFDKQNVPFLYRLSFECFGRSVEVGLSRKYFNQTLNKGLSFLPKTEKLKSMRLKLKERVTNGRGKTKHQR